MLYKCELLKIELHSVSSVDKAVNDRLDSLDKRACRPVCRKILYRSATDTQILDLRLMLRFRLLPCDLRLRFPIGQILKMSISGVLEILPTR